MHSSDPELENEESVEESKVEASADARPAPEDAPQADESAVEDAEAEELDPMTALEQDVMKWRELAMRTAADMENFRKRASREREESMRYANQSLLEELLPILDNFEMGMQAAGQEKDSMIYIGMDMVRKQLMEFLGNNGVEELSAEGQIFDPNLHDAVSQEETTEAEEGVILKVIRRGFNLRDRLLRPATVVVAKAPETSED